MFLGHEADTTFHCSICMQCLHVVITVCDGIVGYEEQNQLHCLCSVEETADSVLTVA